jgi:hypothetical protein
LGSVNTLGHSPKARFNAESILMLSLLLGTPFQLVFDGCPLRIKEVGFSARMSLPWLEAYGA